MWKEYEEAMKKDLPQTCLKILNKISDKSESEKNYASLLKAEFKKVEITDELAPDSMPILKEALLKKVEKLNGKDKVAYAVFNLALYKASTNLKLTDVIKYLDEAFADMDILANTKATDWSMVITAKDGSAIFNNDMLSIMGVNVSQYKRLYDYYKAKGNRRACAWLAQYNAVYGETKNLDKFVEEYKDLPEGAQLAKQYYDYCQRNDEKSAEERYQLLQNYRKQWAGTAEGAIFDNIEKEIQRASLTIQYMPGQVRINEEKTIKVESKNVSKAKLVIIPLNVAARDIPRKTNYSTNYDQELISKYAVKQGNGYKGQIEIAKDFAIENYYTSVKSEITLPALPGGVYMLKLESCDEKDKSSYKHPDGFEINKNQSQVTDYELLYVSNLKIIRLELAEKKEGKNAGDKKERKIVVDSKTGHEIKGAKFETCNWRGICAYTADDNGMPYGQVYGSSYYANNPEKENFQTNIYLDRGIYRPGQTIHATAIVHKIIDGVKTSVIPNTQLTFTLNDANYQEVAEKEVTTDDFGTASVEFVIPSDRLTGNWHIEVDSEDDDDEKFFRVEEYKRPTFEVTFNKYEKEYLLGDTIKVTGVAKTYAGVPVANSKVAYTVKREYPWWGWWRNYGAGQQVMKDTVVTNDKGEFEVTVPLVYPKSDDEKATDKIICYDYQINAAVTSLSGETREGFQSLSASNKPLMLNMTIKEKFLNTEESGLTVNIRNNAGKELKDAKLAITIDDQKKKYASVAEVNEAIKKLPSGRHSLYAEATYKDNVERDTTHFTIFSLDDKKPVEETNHWTYATHTQFKSEDDVITLQFGSSFEDVEVFYDVFVGDEHKESTVLHTSNSLIRKDIKAVKGKNIYVVYAWVKDDQLYSKQYLLRQAVPEKSLNLTWKTFRNKLVPGQQEEWTLNIENPRSKSGEKFQLLACLYDMSLDAIASTSWNTNLGMNTGHMSTGWMMSSTRNNRLNTYRVFKTSSYRAPDMSDFSIWPFEYSGRYNRYFRNDMVMYESAPMPMAMATGGRANVKMAKAAAPVVKADAEVLYDVVSLDAGDMALQEVTVVGLAAGVEKNTKAENPAVVEMRSNFSETAFFYPQLMADKNGDVSIKFTLPESTTTWKFRGFAHDKDMNNGLLEDQIIAQKELMISPNMPRFIRKGDKAVLASVISNISEKTLQTKTTIEILDPATERVLYTESTENTLEPGKTAPVNFTIDQEAIEKAARQESEKAPVSEASASDPLYIVKVFTVADGHSDGEQHYLAVIDNVEPVMTTKSITMIKPGIETVTTADLFPADATDKKLTVEWTENPAWLMLETLPYMNSQDQTTVYSKAAAYYANALGANIFKAMPDNVKRQITQPLSPENNVSALEKNPELKTLLLNETPWVMDAKNETERIQMLKNFYDENKLSYNQEQLISKLKDEQKSDGGWSWCPGMDTSYWMTSEICELFVRLNNMIGKQDATSSMLKKAMNCLQKKAHEEIVEWKKEEKKGNDVYIYDCYALQYVYLKALSGDKLSAEEKKDADFVIKYLKKQERNNSLYMKAKLAIVLYYMGETKIAKEYIQSINEYSAYKELEGRYFDTRRAGYSWRDYKQPTQTMVIEALKAVTPEQQQTIAEYQRWLLMQKRNQIWDTPINTVNNVYAFVSPSRTGGNENVINAFGTDGKGYSKNTYIDKNILPIVEFEKTNDQVSWGAVYAQYKQKTTNVADFSEGLKITREIVNAATSKAVSSPSELKVGDKVKVRITVVAERDYDFVQIVDKRAACLEPANQLSKYQWAAGGGYYVAPQDSRTCYYYDMFRKGTHVLETEYFIDRVGDYQSGTCTVQCAYSPEYYGRTGGITITVK